MKKKNLIILFGIFSIFLISVASAAFNSVLTISGEMSILTDTTAPTCGEWKLRDSSLTYEEAEAQDAFIDSGTNTTWRDTNLILSVDCNDNMSGAFGCVKDHYDIKTYSTTIQTDEEALSVVIKDAYNNQTTCTLPVDGSNPYIDKTNPKITSLSIVPLKGDFEINMVAQDEHSGIKETQFYYKKCGQSNWTALTKNTFPEEQVKNYSNYYIPSNSTEETSCLTTGWGSYYFKADVYDGVGHKVTYYNTGTSGFTTNASNNSKFDLEVPDAGDITVSLDPTLSSCTNLECSLTELRTAFGLYIDPNFSYSISYSMNGGVNSEYNPSSYTYSSNDITLVAPTKTYTVNIAANTQSATIKDTGGNDVTSASSTQTFAGWKGSNGATPELSVTIPTGSMGNKNYIATWTPVGVTLPSITKTGYTCEFNTKADGTGVAYTSGSSYTPNATTNSTTLYAYCRPSTYTVTLNQQSGSGGTSSVTATYNAAMPSITKPTRTGYTFGGYYTSTNGGGTQYYTATGASARTWNLASNTTLYAKWTANKYTVTLNQQSGSGGTSSVTATYNAAMPSITKPTRTGYTFGGYYTSTNGGGTQYYTAAGASARAWNLTSNTTLYAKWTANNYTVKVTPKVDGTTYASGGAYNNGYFTFNVYKAGTLVSSGVNSYSASIPYGTSVRVVAVAHNGFRITANGDVTATVGTSGLTFTPTWTHSTASITYRSAVMGSGAFQSSVTGPALSGTTGQSKTIDQFQVTGISATNTTGSVNWRLHQQDRGDMPSSSSYYVYPGTAVDTGGKRIEGLTMKLTGDYANYFDIYYRVHVQDQGWLNWTSDDAFTGSQGLCKRVEAVKVKVVPKGTNVTLNECGSGETCKDVSVITSDTASNCPVDDGSGGNSGGGGSSSCTKTSYKSYSASVNGPNNAASNCTSYAKSHLHTAYGVKGTYSSSSISYCSSGYCTCTWKEKYTYKSSC